MCITVLQKYLLSRNIQDTTHTTEVKSMIKPETTTVSEEEKISKIISQVMKKVFGKEAAHLIFQYLENRCSLKQNEIAGRIDVFAKGLEEFLDSGAYAIERKILEDIYSSYGLLRQLELQKTHEDHNFVGQIRNLMQRA